MKNLQNSTSKEAEKIIQELSQWLRENDNDFVPSHLVERYAICKARWRLCEEKLQAGLLVKDPANGRAVQSPYIAIEEKYMNNTVKAWEAIARTIKETTGKSVADDATLFDI